LNGAAPEKIFPRESEVNTMFKGMTIDELIQSVERAEQHARELRETKVFFHETPVRRTEWQEMVEVA
jgi:hypothetical protein